MAITNKEIINNQVKRINKKVSATFIVGKDVTGEYLFLQSDKPIFENMECYRTEEQMIEYLAGMEDAIDYFQRQKA